MTDELVFPNPHLATWEDREKSQAAINRLYKDVMDVILVWAWDDEDKVYRNDETGEVMDEETMIALRDEIVDWQVDFFSKWPVDEDEEPKDEKDSNILALLLLGLITLATWESRMRQAIRDSALIDFSFGRGGFDHMLDADWSWLEDWLVVQYSFLNEFSKDIAAGELTELQIAARSYLYFSSSVAAFEYGRMKAQDADLDLTRHPGDCTSQCCARDRCYWTYTHLEGSIVCRWIRTAAESCNTCIDRATICPAVLFMKDNGEHINMECYEQADAA
ncbi:MAG: hypothetical protein ACXAB4_04870 [Candidatus Hodarchaeales archaeon]|jgi:hypothetical protein